MNVFGTYSVSGQPTYAKGPILTFPTIFHFIRVSEFSLLKGAIVVIFVSFGGIEAVRLCHKIFQKF